MPRDDDRGRPGHGGGGAAVHRLEHTVAARLHGQVEERHQLGRVAMRGDQLVVHVGRVAGGVADTREAIDRGDVAEARDEINDVITEGNGIPEAFYVRAEIAFAENRLDAARTDVDKAIKRAPKLVAAHALKGRILDARGDAAGAKEAYRKARDLPVDGFEVRPARRLATAGLSTAAASSKPAKTSHVALNASTGKVECKRFLPATGTIITADCDD